ncbi:MAG TPA: FGGY family carbohydrate kinase, partial [Chloroflexota bacterium]
MRYVLAHDVGTTGNKATLYDEEGALAGSTFVAYGTVFPRTGWVEQNPDDWWRSLCTSTHDLLHQTSVAASDIACVAFSGQMMGAVAVDAQARPLRNAIIWADQRAVSQIDRVAEHCSPHDVYAITGHRLSPSYSAAKMLWLKDMEPQTYSQTFKFLQAKDFLAAKLTGMYATDPSDASGTNLYDLKQGVWSNPLVEAFGIERD